MKLSVFPALLTIIVGIIIGYLSYHIGKSNLDSNDIIAGIGTSVSVILTLGCIIGVSINDSRINVNMRAWSIVAFVVTTIVNLCYAYFGISMPYYVIVIALMLIIHLWVVWKMLNIKRA